MKKQVTRPVQAHLLRGTFYLLLLLAVCAIPFALAQQVAVKRSALKPSTSAIAQSQLLTLPNGCGLEWRVVASPNSGTVNNTLYGLAATSPSDVWAVGYYYSEDIKAQILIEHWDGSAWTIVTSPSPSSTGNTLNAVAALASNDVWAVGSYYNPIASTLIEHWDGTSWSVVASPNNGGNGSYLHGVTALTTDNVWAVGAYFDNNQVWRTLVEHWDGTSWSIVNSPNRGIHSSLSGIAAVSSSDIWAVGSSNLPNLTLIEHWDGNAWSIIDSPNPVPNNNSLRSVTVVPGGDVWAVGSYYSVGPQGAHALTLIERWDGSNWNIVSSPNIAGAESGFLSVSGAAANDVCAVGLFQIPPRWPPYILIERWDGSNWNVVPSPTADNYDILYAVTAISTGDAWSVGAFANGNFGQTLTLHYNDPCATPTPTPTPPVSPTMTPTPTLTGTPRPTPTIRPRPTPPPRPIPPR